MRLRAAIIGLVFIALCLPALPAQGASVSGRVFEDGNRNGVLDLGEPCVPAIVSLRPAAAGGAQTFRVDCEQAPTYRFDLLPRGDYLIGLNEETLLPGYGPSSTEPVKRLTLGTETAVQLDLPVYQRTGAIHGRVFEDVNNDQRYDAGDHCVSSVVALRPTGGGPERTTRLDCRYGVYLFNAVEPGEYTVSVKETTSPDYGTAAVVVNLPPGGVIQQDLRVRRPSIQGTVYGRDDQRLADVVVMLQDGSGSMLAVTTTDAAGGYRFERLARGVYQVVGTDPPGTESSDALPGRRAEKINDNTLQVTIGFDLSTQYLRNDFVKNLSRAPTPSIGRLLELGQSIDVREELGYSAIVPVDLDPGDSVIRRVTADGALIVLKPEGTALLRVGVAGSEFLLDTTDKDPVDGVALSRLLRVETSQEGISAILALRADDTRGIYRLDAPRRLARLALLSDPSGPAELAISDGGQIAYVAPDDAGTLALFQTGRTAPLLRQGDEVEGWTVAGFRELSANDDGDVAVLVSGIGSEGKTADAVVRWTRRGQEVVAITGDEVRWGRGVARTDALFGFVRPRIGPNGTVVFGGWGKDFSNFYVARPGLDLAPLLTGTNWSLKATDIDYAIAASGAVALRAFDYPLVTLYLATPIGLRPLAGPGGEALEPVGRPVFAPTGQLFFLAKDSRWPRDRNGRIPVGLFRYDPDTANLVAVATPGAEAPGKEGQRLLGVPQHPVVSRDTVAFAATFGGRDRFPVPTADLFRVPVAGTLANGSPVVEAVDQLQGDARLVGLRDLYYTGDGTLVFDTLVRRWLILGQLILTLTPPGSTASGFGTQAVRAENLTPTLVPGHDLGGGRRLRRTLGRLVALPPNRHLFVAEYSHASGAGEGLFTIDQNRQVQPIALKNEPALGPGLTGARFVGFGDTVIHPPSVSANGNVVFKARLERDNVDSFGIFQWRLPEVGPPPVPTAIGAAPPIAENLRLTAEDHLPYRLERWAAGTAGDAYFLEQHQTRAGAPVSRLFTGSAGGPALMAAAGPGPNGGTGLPVLAELFDLMMNGAGELFLQGADASHRGVFRVERDDRTAGLVRLMPVVRQGDTLPSRDDGQMYPDLQFDGSFTLRRDSACGALLFEADVRRRNDKKWRTRGIFYLNPQGVVRTGLVAGVGLNGAREVALAAIPPDGPCDQPLRAQSVTQNQWQVIQTFAFAARDSAGRWAIYRSQEIRHLTTGRTALSAVIIAREAQAGEPMGKNGYVALDPSTLLGRQSGSGPVFAVNAAGDVAFLASDGQRWGIYRFTEG